MRARVQSQDRGAHMEYGGDFRPEDGDGFINVPDGVDEELPFNEVM